MALLMALGVGTVIFLLIHLVPGDVADVILAGGGGQATAEQYEALRHSLGLDKPMYFQFGRWLFGLIQGDLGTSLITGRDVGSDIFRQLPRTLELILGSLLVALVIGIPGGIFAAIKSNSKYDMALTSFFLLGLSLPNFVVGTMMILVFGLYLGWLPLAGYISFAGDPWRHFQLLLFPSLALGFAIGAVIFRMTRSSMLEVLRQDYIRTARAKGLTEFLVNFNHALRNALIPVVTITGIEMGTLFGGTVVVEYVFSWPGLSTLLIQGVYRRDYPMVQAVVLLMSGSFIVLNLIVDIVNAYLDPRIRYK
jgi:peptide/nickel transport system permease protein